MIIYKVFDGYDDEASLVTIIVGPEHSNLGAPGEECIKNAMRQYRKARSDASHERREWRSLKDAEWEIAHPWPEPPTWPDREECEAILCGAKKRILREAAFTGVDKKTALSSNKAYQKALCAKHTYERGREAWLRECQRISQEKPNYWEQCLEKFPLPVIQEFLPEGFQVGPTKDVWL